MNNHSEKKEITGNATDSASNIGGEKKNFVPKKHDWKTSLLAVLFVVPLGLFFWFGFQHLGQFETADEYRWIYADSRIPRYWSAMERHDWNDTWINDKPGISTAIVSGLALKEVPNLGARISQQNRFSSVSNPDAAQQINFMFRLPLLVFNGLLAILWYFMLRRLLENNWAALFSSALVLLSPILIGISQIVNPDALLWSTAFTSILAFLLFLKYRNWYSIILSGLFLGFALLSKYSAVIIAPYFFVLMIAYLVYSYDSLIEENVFRKRVLQYALFYPLIFALAVLVYSLLLPAIFINPKSILVDGNEAFHDMVPYLQIIGWINLAILFDALILKSWILKKILWPFKYLWNIGSRAVFGGFLLIASLVVFNYHRGNFWGITDIPFDAGTDSGFAHFPIIYKIFLEILPFIFSLTPAALVLIALGLLAYIFKKQTANAFVLLALCLFFPFFYYAVLDVGFPVTIRYSIMLYPLALAIAGIGAAETVPQFRFRPLVYLAMFALIIWVGASSLQKSYPFYFNYANDLLPKGRIITGAWGYGGYEAASFINAQSAHPENLIVWTDYDGFCPFFKGLCIKDSDVKWVGSKTVKDIDYYVTTRRGTLLLKDTWAKLAQNTVAKPDFELDIDGRPGNFIRVYKTVSNISDNPAPAVITSAVKTEPSVKNAAPSAPAAKTKSAKQK